MKEKMGVRVLFIFYKHSLKFISIRYFLRNYETIIQLLFGLTLNGLTYTTLNLNKINNDTHLI